MRLIPDYLWCALAAIGLCSSIAAITIYQRSQRAVRKIGNADDREVAHAIVGDYLAGEVLRLAGHAVSLFVGIQAIFIPPAPPHPVPHAAAVFGFEVLCVLIVLNALLVANSIRAFVAWRQRWGMAARGYRRGVRRKRTP